MLQTLHVQIWVVEPRTDPPTKFSTGSKDNHEITGYVRDSVHEQVSMKRDKQNMNKHYFPRGIRRTIQKAKWFAFYP